jgi:hypothetical protein
VEARQICPRIATIRQGRSRAVNSRQPRAHKQVIQVVSVRREDDCVISRQRAAAKREPPACLNRERLCERPLCELACLVSYLRRRVRADAEIGGLLSDAVCVNALLLRRVHKVEPKNDLFAVWQNDVKAVSVIPALRLVDATLERLKRSSGRRVLREREQRNEQRCEGRDASCHGFVKELTGSWRGASVKLRQTAERSSHLVEQFLFWLARNGLGQ